MPRIVTLNIRHGGGQRVPLIIETIVCLRPDVIVLTEYRNGVVGERLRAALKKEGWSHQVAAPTQKHLNSVLVAGRFGVSIRGAHVSETTWEQNRHLIVQTKFCTVMAVYLPPGLKKRPSWDRVIATARDLVAEPTILIGDFNTGKHYIDEDGATFIGPEYIDQLESLGYRDSWRAVNPESHEYTWFSSAKNGFRLDYAFLSPVLAPRLSCAKHVDTPRLKGVTDHSALLVDLQ